MVNTVTANPCSVVNVHAESFSDSSGEQLTRPINAKKKGQQLSVG